MWRSLLLAACASCSFFAVHGPTSAATPGAAACTDSDLVPSLDAIVGALGVAGAIGGEIADQLSAHPIKHFELFIGLPALVAGIAFFVASSQGTSKVEACRALRQGEVRDCDGCADRVP